MTMQRTFPVHASSREYSKLKSIPWHIMELGRKRAEDNHGQTLERLAERSGLAICEMADALRDQPLRFHGLKETQDEDLAFVLKFIEDHLND